MFQESKYLALTLVTLHAQAHQPVIEAMETQGFTLPNGEFFDRGTVP